MNEVAPIFIIGAPRSGTSITTWAVGQHPNIQPMPETGWLAAQAVGSYLSWVKGSERGIYSHLSNVEWPLEAFMEEMGRAAHRVTCQVFEERCRSMYGDYKSVGYVERKPTKEPGPKMDIRHEVEDPKARWVDGTPANSLYTWGLKLLFPNAKFIHNLRSPKEVIRSLLNFERAGGEKRELEPALTEWAHMARFSYYTQLAYGHDSTYVLDFTRLKDDRGPLLKEVFDFLDEPNSSRALKVFDNKINSSKVDGVAFDDRLLELEGYKTANELYENALSWAPLEEGEDALELIKRQFLDHTLQRNLI